MQRDEELSRQQASKQSNDKQSKAITDDDVQRAVQNAVRSNERRLRDLQTDNKRLQNDVLTLTSQLHLCEADLLQARTQYRNKLNELFLSKPENQVIANSGAGSPQRGASKRQDPEVLLNEILGSYAQRELRLQDELVSLKKINAQKRESSRTRLGRYADQYI
jgi:hypothetical protein